MSLDLIHNSLSQRIEMAFSNFHTIALAKVIEFNSERYTIKVSSIWSNDTKATGEIPIMVSCAGNGWGIKTPIAIGSVAVIAFVQGSANVPLCLGFLWVQGSSSPSADSETILLEHDSGAKIELDKLGKVKIQGANIELSGLTTLSNLSELKGMLTSDFIDFYNSHTHLSAAAGQPTSSPTTQITDQVLTKKVKAE